MSWVSLGCAFHHSQSVTAQQLPGFGKLLGCPCLALWCARALLNLSSAVLPPAQHNTPSLARAPGTAQRKFQQGTVPKMAARKEPLGGQHKWTETPLRNTSHIAAQRETQVSRQDLALYPPTKASCTTLSLFHHISGLFHGLAHPISQGHGAAPAPSRAVHTEGSKCSHMQSYWQSSSLPSPAAGEQGQDSSSCPADIFTFFFLLFSLGHCGNSQLGESEASHQQTQANPIWNMQPILHLALDQLTCPVHTQKNSGSQ